MGKVNKIITVHDSGHDEVKRETEYLNARGWTVKTVALKTPWDYVIVFEKDEP